MFRCCRKYYNSKASAHCVNSLSVSWVLQHFPYFLTVNWVNKIWNTAFCFSQVVKTLCERFKHLDRRPQPACRKGSIKTLLFTKVFEGGSIIEQPCATSSEWDRKGWKVSRSVPEEEEEEWWMSTDLSSSRNLHRSERGFSPAPRGMLVRRRCVPSSGGPSRPSQDTSRMPKTCSWGRWTR